MNINELHGILSRMIKNGHGDELVVLSSDPEGNSYLRLSEVNKPRMMWDTGYELEPISDEYDDDFDEEETGVMAVILYP